MCVIIHRPAGITIPEDKIISACLVNSDGWGIAVADRGKIELFREFDPTGNDPDKVLKALENAKDQDILAHLRFTTVGEKSLENTQPFFVTKKDEDGIDCVFTHNGTLYDYRDKTMSDSRIFAMAVVRPLIQRVRAYIEDPFNDPFTHLILGKYINSSSVFALFDGNGKHLYVNKGVEFLEEGGKKWWASNDYSFNRYHREKPPFEWDQDIPNYGQTGYSDYYDSWKSPGQADHNKCQTSTYNSAMSSEKKPGSFGFTNGRPSTTPPANTNGGISAVDRQAARKGVLIPLNAASARLPDANDKQFTELEEQVQNIAKSLQDMKNTTPLMNPKMVLLLSKKRRTFCEMAKVDSLKELTRLDEDDLLEICTMMPDAAAVLMADLMYELYYKSLKPPAVDHEAEEAKASLDRISAAAAANPAL